VYALHAEFYRFLDREGRLITPPKAAAVGTLQPAEVAQLRLKEMPHGPQLAYLVRQNPGGDEILEVMALPIYSSETGEPIAALMLGFKAVPLSGGTNVVGIRRGIVV